MKERLILLVFISLILSACSFKASVIDTNLPSAGLPDAAPAIPSIEITPPTVSTSSAINSSNKTAFSVNGACPTASGIVSVSVNADPAGQVTCHNGEYTISLDLSSITDGSVTIEVSLETGVSTSVSLTKDSNPPSVAISSPVDTSFINQSNNSSTYSITGTCTEPGREVLVMIDGVASGSGGLCNGASFSASINTTALSSGSHSLTVSLSDVAGNSTISSAISVIMDITPPATPSLALTDSVTASTTVATTSPLNLSILSDTDAVEWCVLEQPSTSAAPATPTIDHTCWANTKPVNIAVSGAGSRTVYVYTKDEASNVSTVAATDSIDFQVSNPTLALSDGTTGSTSYARQVAVSASIGSDSIAAKWCISQTQSTAPASGSATCNGGSGPSNGWYTARPTSFSLTTGDGAKTVYLWIATSSDVVNTGPVSDSITLDTALPAKPTVTMTDPNSNSPGIAYVETVNLSITGDSGATMWCTIEQDSTLAAPSKPAWDDLCFKSIEPTTLILGGMGSRTTYVFTRDIALNVSNTYGSNTISRQNNSAPVAGDDIFTLVAGDTNPNSVQVFANDTDPNLDFLSISAATNGAHGTVSIHASNKHLIYTLTEPAYVGADSFTYTAVDPYGNSDIATVNINIVPLANWLNHKVITISGSINPTAIQTDYALLVHLSADAQLVTKAQNLGQDILFTDSTGAVLRHEIEKYESTSGLLYAWVKIPSLAANTNFDIKMYYNNATAQAMERPFDVWSNGYATVLHLNEDPSITSDGYCAGEHRHECDSSPNHRHARRNGTLDPIDLVAGKAGGALSFADTTDYLDYTCTGCPSYPFTISLWMKTPTFSGNLISYEIGPNRSLAFTGSYLHAGVGGDYRGIAITEFLANTWHYVTAVFTTSTDHKVYLDGVDKTVATNDWWGAFGFGIGRRVSGSALNYNGMIDEIRISAQAQTPALIDSQFKNQNNPASYITVGAER